MTDRDTNLSTVRGYLPVECDDAALVARARAGDEAAFEVVVRRYQRVLFNVALRMLGNRDEAADAAQDAFVKAYEHLDAYDSSRPFFSWLYRIVANACFNELRRRGARIAVMPPLEAPGGQFERLEAKERRARVQAAILALPIEQREVVVLRHFAELSYEEIAATVGVEMKTVKSRLYEARQRLAHMLVSERGGYRHATRR